VTALLAAAVIAGSTGYCLNGTMADGTWTRPGSVAHNGYPLGTRLTIAPSPTGRRRFVVRDRIGWGTELDFWVSSCARAIAWGRRTVKVRVGWPKRRKPVRVGKVGPGRAGMPPGLIYRAGGGWRAR